MNVMVRFVRYFSVALLAAGADWLVFLALTSAVGLWPLTGLMIARIAGGLMSFLSNRYWTWGANRKIALTQQGRRFVLLYAFSYALSIVLFRLLTEALLLTPYLGKLTTDICCFIVNFLVMNFYVFHARAGFARFFGRADPASDATIDHSEVTSVTAGYERPGDAQTEIAENSPGERKAFWDAKILAWEASRYDLGASPNFVEGVAGRVSSSVRYRMDAAVRLLAPHLAGCRVVELGCGSGLLAEKLLALGAASYQGYDISSVAIARAKQRAAQSPRGDAMLFDVAALTDLPSQDNALVVSLGLIEWLTPAELDYLFAISSKGSLFHGLSERRRSVTQLIHRGYVYLSYGWKTGGYVPRYHDVAEIAAIAKRHHIDRLNVYRQPRLRFGIFVSNLTFD